MKRKILITKDKKSGDKKAFEIIKNQILKKPDSLIGLAAGKTIDGLYNLISGDAAKNPNKWKKVKLIQIDENLGVKSDSPISFNHEIRTKLKLLFKIVNPKNVFLMDGLKDPKETIKKANTFIKKNKGIDLIILGIGPEYDPHIAYNTTGKSSLDSRMRVVDLHSKTVEKIKASKGTPWRAPTKGITLGIQDILKAKKALLIAYGKEKAKSIQLAFGDKKVNIKKASASALLLHKNLTIVLDKEAGIFLL